MKALRYALLSLMFCTVVSAQTPEGTEPATKEAVADTPARDEVKHKEAVALMTKVDEATKAVEMVNYKATFHGTGAAATRVPKVEGTVTMSGKSEATAKFRVEGKLQRDSAETKEFVAGHDGEDFYLIDPAKKMVYADIDPAIITGEGRALMGLMMREFIHPTPFSDEINANTAEIQGSEKIGEEDCLKVYIKYSQQNQEAYWYVSKKDFLPRRVDRMMRSAAGETGSTELILTDLTLKATGDPFKLVIPEGYEKTDEPPQDRRPPA